MSFANWSWLLLLLALPFIWRRQGEKKPATLPHPDVLSKLKSYGRKAKLKIALPKIFRVAALALLIIALARPQIGLVSDTSNRYGVDIMVCLDVSSSMAAEDFQPSRISVAKETLADFINSRPDDRLGLIVFGSQSYLQCPLTGDHKTLLAFLAEVNIGLAEDGTAVGMALANAVKRLKDTQAKSKLILLLTDGENNTGAVDPATAAKLAATYGIRIYAIGIGNPEGAPIPFIDPWGNKAYARNPDGSIFLTKMNAAGLKEIAEITNGAYFIASDADKLSRIFREIDKMEKTKFEAKTPYVFNELYGVFALLALILILLEWTVSRFWTRSVP